MKPIKTFFFNGIVLTITSLIIRFTIIFFNSYISQKVGAEAVGLYGLVMSVYGFAITIALSGINLATTKIIAEEIAIGNIGNSRKIVKKSMFFCLVFSAISMLILISFAPLICKTWLHNKISTTLFYIISVSLPFLSMSSCISGYFTAVRSSIKPASCMILEQCLKIFFITSILNFFMPCGLEYICISLILGNVISEIISFLYAFFLYKTDEKKLNKYKTTNSFFEGRILHITIPVGLTSFLRSRIIYY